ncbi:hypothetical protein DSECCO2_647260 [anaerobic digester metagenome]
MKTLLRVSAISLFTFVCLLSLHATPVKEVITKEQALKEISKIKKETRQHVVAIGEIEKFARESTTNFSNFVLYAQLASKVGYHTDMYVRLAEATSKLTEENEVLNELADLVQIPDLGTDRFEALLNAAISAKSAEEKDRVLQQIVAIRDAL